MSYLKWRGKKTTEEISEGTFPDYLLSMLWAAYESARKGKRNTEDEHKFEMNAAENLRQLRDDIVSRRYRPSRGIAFITKNPVMREIFAAPFRDRVVHHLLYNVCNNWWDKRLIEDSYSCRKGKGTLYGIYRLAQHIQSCSENYSVPTYVIKLDIQACFMSLNRKMLYERLLWGLDRQFSENRGELYLTCKFLWRQILLDNPVSGVRLRGHIRDWDDLPRSKSLFNQPEGVGIVIGNLTSQLASNVYLDQLDRFVKFTLGYKHYGRYVDDFYIIVTKDNLSQALNDIEAIRLFLISIGLTLHPKKVYVQPTTRGVPYLGAMIYPGEILPGKRIKRNFARAAVDFSSGHADLNTIISYLGLMSNYKSAGFERKIFSELGWEFYT